MSKISSRISNMSANFKIGFTQYRQNSIYIMASANAELAILVDISRLDSHNTDRTLVSSVHVQGSSVFPIFCCLNTIKEQCHFHLALSGRL
ncbi:uncharacterized protein LOC144486897 [Mustelus asterias]